MADGPVEKTDAPRTPRRELAVVLVFGLVLLAACFVKSLTARNAGNEIRVVRGVGEPGFRIDVNTATADELRLLPGIGPDKAERIVAWRTAHGAFRRPQDLARVRGISSRSLAALRGLIVCGLRSSSE